MSFFGKKHSGRRAFLRSAAGATLGLPLLEYTHGHVFAQDGAPKRFLTVFSHGGSIIPVSRGGDRIKPGGNSFSNDMWKPSSDGEDLVFGPIHQALNPFVRKCMILRGVENGSTNGQAPYGGGQHGWSNVTALTCADAKSVGDDDRTSMGPSIDTVLAERLAAQYPVARKLIHLNVKGHQYGSPYYDGAERRRSGVSDPKQAFDDLFAGVSEGGGPSDAEVRARRKEQSVLNGLMGGFSAMKKRVGQADGHVLDAHLEHIHSLESEIAGLIAQPPMQCTKPSIGEASGAEAIGPLHVKIIAAALRCGITNVANLEIADILTPWTEAGLQVDSAHGIGHSLGHTGRDVGPSGPSASLEQRWYAEIADNRRWRLGLVAQLLAELDAVPEGSGTMLDNSLLLYTSEFSNGSVHSATDLPILLAGSAGGHFRTGRHVNYNTATGGSYNSSASTHNLFTSILQAFGQPDTHFGNDILPGAKGPLAGLT